MSPLPTPLRSALEKAVIAARDEAEKAARAALVALAVERPEPFATLPEQARRLRVALRARARQLGGGDLAAGLAPLAEEVAYEGWHRMLFARFLAENTLLMHPSGVAVSLADCADLAAEEGDPEGTPDAWTLAARYAALMLPGIFRNDDPSARVRFAPEGQQALERILTALPPAVFTSDDALGWVYQFWQTRKKEEVNKSGRKIGGSDLAPVTQLFTEDYMVRFLLENSLGAWWATRHPNSPLLSEWDYLRYRDDGTPAAGTFPGWPAHAAQVTVMDPCCGSGHFEVVAFEMLRRMRMEEEGLSEAEAGDAVLRDNLFGLELDPRCTQIAAFALALAAWKAGGYRPLPLPNIACSGIPVQGQLEEWKKLAAGDVKLETTLEHLYTLFKNAPDLGSLIDPAAVPAQAGLFDADYATVAPLLARALEKGGTEPNSPAAAVFGGAALSAAHAAILLGSRYTLVITNVPYLGLKKQNPTLRVFSETRFPEAKMDLATVFIERCRIFTSSRGSYAVVTPQVWLFLSKYITFRERMLKEQTWEQLARLGVNAFDSIGGEVVNVSLLIISNHNPEQSHRFSALDVSLLSEAREKQSALYTQILISLRQDGQLCNPDARISLDTGSSGMLLSEYAYSYAGLQTGDYQKLVRCFWEMPAIGGSWRRCQSTVLLTELYGGREHVLLWEDDGQRLTRSSGARVQGKGAWNRAGVVVSQMGRLPVTVYTGDIFDVSTAAIVPQDPSHFLAIWNYCRSADFPLAVRRIDQKMNVTNATLVKVPFDLAHWQKVADAAGPLPEPYSNDPTQWLFKGHPVGSTAPLQVAVARLLAYQWPEQQKEDLVLDGLEVHAGADGIVCLPPITGEHPAAERLRTLLVAAYGEGWSLEQQDRLLAEVGYAGKGLDLWLRDGFFAQQCALFHNRPFIWHIWDGRKDGFSALVNYHKLDAARLNRLIYTYLGAWITTQRAQSQAGVAGADGRLVAALELQKKLEAIRDGEPPHDIYVRWKHLHEQPIGWEPDLNDGVRLNIRPFVTAGVLRGKFTINWNKDRGINPDGSERLNDLHRTVAEKQEARRAAGLLR